jgi:hypothetical protein
MKKIFLSLIVCLSAYYGHAQALPAETKVSSYIGIVHPIYTVQNGDITTNFKDFYLVGLTTAIIIKKAQNYAYNLELVAFVREQNGSVRASNIMIHPGVTRYFKKDFSITPRLGFESSGRFGPSLIFTKTMAKPGGHPLNFNLVNLVRFGADQRPSYTQAINLTFGF